LSGQGWLTRRPRYVAAIKLLIFTGARLGEILGLRWEWIDFDRGAKHDCPRFLAEAAASFAWA
jgi:integrase